MPITAGLEISADVCVGGYAQLELAWVSWIRLGLIWFGRPGVCVCCGVSSSVAVMPRRLIIAVPGFANAVIAA